MRTWLRIALCSCFSVWLASCGTRAGIAAEADTDDDFGGFDAGAGRPCGQGKPCNPKDLGGRTCDSLGLQDGELSCDPKTCNLVLTKCSGYASSSSSSGTGGMTGSPGTSTGMGVPGGDIPGMFGTTGGSGGAAAVFGAGFFGTPTDGGVAFFGGQPGFFGNAQGNDEDGGTDNTPPNPGFFGAGFFGGNNNAN